MTIEELNAELRQIRLEVFIETLTEWSAEEVEDTHEDRWCEGFVAGQNHAKELIKGLLENISI